MAANAGTDPNSIAVTLAAAIIGNASFRGLNARRRAIKIAECNELALDVARDLIPRMLGTAPTVESMREADAKASAEERAMVKTETQKRAKEIKKRKPKTITLTQFPL
jgi:hypothetical protein